MSLSHRHLGNTSGQILLMSVMLGSIIIMASTAIFFATQVGSRHRIASTQKTAGRGVLDEGLGYAIGQLSANQTRWTQALNGNFSGTDCNTGVAIDSPAGNSFKVYCSTGIASNPSIQPYQVAVRILALNPQTKNPDIATRAYLSQRTLGADLASGLHMSAAVQLIRQPASPPEGSLNVDWGPIVCMDSSNPDSWVLPSPIDAKQYPRKVSAGGLTGAVNRSGNVYGDGPKTDQKEYWAHSSMVSYPLIDEDYYMAAATNSIVNVGPVNGAGVPIPRFGCASGVNCAVFKPDPGDTAIFDASGSGYIPPQGVTIVVLGSAEFKNSVFDVSAMIVTGDLSITQQGQGMSYGLHVPAKASLEYPYTPDNPHIWPCQDREGTLDSNGAPVNDCSTVEVFNSGRLHYRGFLYVKGNMALSPTVSEYNLVGSLWVGDHEATAGSGGRLSLSAGSGLNVAYDDAINHAIKMNPISGETVLIVPDQIKPIPVF